MKKVYKRCKSLDDHWSEMVEARPRTTRMKPQFRLEELYVMPFTARRVYDPDGNVTWQEMDPTPRKTGISVLDELLAWVAKGESSLYWFCRDRGIKTAELSALVLLVTDVATASDVRLWWQARQGADLLRYTKLSISEVAAKSGVGTASNLNKAMNRFYGMSPTAYRRSVRQRGDVGRFRL